MDQVWKAQRCIPLGKVRGVPHRPLPPHSLPMPGDSKNSVFNYKILMIFLEEFEPKNKAALFTNYQKSLIPFLQLLGIFSTALTWESEKFMQ